MMDGKPDQFSEPERGDADASSVFAPISLEETLSEAAMLTRVDNKYLVNRCQFRSLFNAICDQYRLLTISDRSRFAYRSKYFDDSYRAYYEHHQGRRRRFKLRIREYVDSGDVYFELKLKGLRGQTVKFRQSCDSFCVDQLDDNSPYYQLARDWYENAYQRRFADRLSASLIVHYARISLVSVVGSERVTIDTDIVYEDAYNGESWDLSDNIAVVETKTEKGAGVMDHLLKKNGSRQVSKCSKYCLGLALGNRVARVNRFLPVLRKIRDIDRVSAPFETRRRG